jgi:hypothetical protein
VKPHDCSGAGCFGCKIKTVSFAASAMPTRKPEVAATNRRESNLTKDRDAFKAMRQQGIQPARLKGAAELQDKAHTKHEIETGKLIGNKSLATKVEKAVKEIG